MQDMTATEINAEEERLFLESYGAKAVGYTFNPSQLIAVQVIKRGAGNLINELDQTRTDATDPEVKRMCALSITHLQEASMWAVKALTWESK